MEIECMPIKKYNQRQMDKWLADVDKWKERRDNSTIPQILSYFFYTECGKQRQTGYVVIAGGSHYWAMSKAEAIEKACDGIKEG